MRLLSRLLGLLLVLIAFAIAGLMAAAVQIGESLAQPLGQIWFAVDAGSLNAFQALVERHIWPPVWDLVVFPLLMLQAVLVLVVVLALGMILLILARVRRTNKRRLFDR